MLRFIRACVDACACLSGSFRPLASDAFHQRWMSWTTCYSAVSGWTDTAASHPELSELNGPRWSPMTSTGRATLTPTTFSLQSPSSAEISYTVFQLDHPLLLLQAQKEKKKKNIFPMTHIHGSRITGQRRYADESCYGHLLFPFPAVPDDCGRVPNLSSIGLPWKWKEGMDGWLELTRVHRPFNQTSSSELHQFPRNQNLGTVRAKNERGTVQEIITNVVTRLPEHWPHCQLIHSLQAIDMRSCSFCLCPALIPVNIKEVEKQGWWR